MLAWPGWRTSWMPPLRPGRRIALPGGPPSPSLPTPSASERSGAKGGPLRDDVGRTGKRWGKAHVGRSPRGGGPPDGVPVNLIAPDHRSRKERARRSTNATEPVAGRAVTCAGGREMFALPRREDDAQAHEAAGDRVHRSLPPLSAVRVPHGTSARSPVERTCEVAN